MEEPSVPPSPPPAEAASAVSAAAPAEGDSGSASGSPPPQALGEILAFLDHPQQARQSALASLPYCRFGASDPGSQCNRIGQARVV